VTLTLIFDDMSRALPQMEGVIDCWFLDGFKPKKNPDMWGDILFQNMARLSPPGATFATFTAAGNVRRGLKAAGFDVSRIKGYGTKWHMLTGVRI
jgi:tRNA 5-methylaminomethyl-2-thiouridine biosynthesis bifunctional protein